MIRSACRAFEAKPVGNAPLPRSLFSGRSRWGHLRPRNSHCSIRLQASRCVTAQSPRGSLPRQSSTKSNNALYIGRTRSFVWPGLLIRLRNVSVSFKNGSRPRGRGCRCRIHLCWDRFLSGNPEIQERIRLIKKEVHYNELMLNWDSIRTSSAQWGCTWPFLI